MISLKENYTRYLLIFLLSFISSFAFSQTKENKTFKATRVYTPPKIDGNLSDSVWMLSQTAEGFTQLEPNPGMPARKRTEVKIVYDDNAVYIGAFMHDEHPDSILHELGPRDVFDESNTDLFAMVFDTYHDQQHGFVFSVSAAGVQSDFKIAGEDFDGNWNAVWQSEVKITTEGWVAEIRIPYSAIRFPKKEIQEWGVNFTRLTRRFREFSNWNKIDPKESGFVNQSGTLTGIEKIVSPLRLSLTPYVSAYAENYPYNVPGKNNTGYLFNGGMDLKYGLSESFTLDMTLIADFGQVQSDKKVLNLSPFEVLYDENRPFFTEGTDLFGRADIFYSRRVGGLPVNYDLPYLSAGTDEIVEEDPLQSRLYNATKLTGRTKKGFGLGIFNATSAPVFGTLLDTITGQQREIMTQPLANYNVTVFDQTFLQNSNFTLINTNVMREGEVYDANVTGTQFKLANKKNSYAIQSYSAVSVQPGLTKEPGFKYLVNIGKLSGNYQVSLVERVTDDKFDPNDLGYLEKRNEYNHYLNQSYNIYKPFWRIVKMSNDIGIDYLMLYKPRLYRVFNMDFSSDMDFRNYFTLGIFGGIKPIKKNYDFYEPRVEGRYYIFADNYLFGNYFSSDSRKKFHLGGSYSYHWWNERNRYSYDYSISPRYRFSNRFSLSASSYTEILHDDVGYVGTQNDTIIFGIRNVNTINNEITATYIFTNHMSLSLTARHYWSKAAYTGYFALSDNGGADPTNYSLANDIDFNAFNIDMVYTWQFSPGSEMSIVWKNSIYKIESALAQKYFDSLNQTLDSPQTNSFSIKILYYLDYRAMQKALSKKKKK